MSLVFTEEKQNSQTSVDSSVQQNASLMKDIELKKAKKTEEGAIPVRIHGNWYDFASFEHPGGPVALALAKDRDATALYELHHPFSNKEYMAKTLEKYRLDEAEVASRGLVLDKQEDDEDFVWEEKDEFREDLVEAVNGYFKDLAKKNGTTVKEAIKMPWSTWALMWTIFGLWAITYGFYCAGHAWTIIVMPVLMWLSTGRMLHDGSHFALSLKWRINQIGTHAGPWWASSSSWFIQHVIGHHAHTNIPNRDPDLYHGPENWRYVPHLKWLPQYRLQHYLFPLMWAGATMTIGGLVDIFDMNYYNGVVMVGDRTTKHYFFWLAVRVGLMSIFFGAPIYFVGFLKGMIFFLLTWIAISAIFMLFTQVSHLDELCGTARYENFWRHQFATSSDYSCQSKFWCVASIGLNCQVIHHTFPTVNPAHFPALYPLVKAVCDKHGVEYQEKANLWEAFREYWNALALYSHTDEELEAMNKKHY